MSWVFQRPDGAEGMAPRISHEQLLTNRDALERKLSQRGPRDELVNRGIMPAVSAAPGILSQRTKLERAKTGDLLQKKFRGRPNRAQLIQRHILKETPGVVDPSLIDKQMRLKRKKLEDDLNDKLTFRPGPLELVKENILEAGTPMGQAVQEGTVPFTDTTPDYLDSLSPDSQGSPELSSPDPSLVSSPPSIPSPLGSTCISSTVQALASLQAQTRKQTQQQQEQQQQQHQLFLQQQNGQQLAQQPSQLLTSQAPSQTVKKEGRSRKKASKPKVKKYKYHEYRPPNGEVQKCELASDSPYGLLLQQQQLYLQLQVLYQNYPQHCMLPSIPENVKLGGNINKNNGNNNEAEKPVRIEDMRVIDMRRALKDRKLPVFGSKTDLIKRLKDAEFAESQGAAVSSSGGVPVEVSAPGLTTTAPSMSQIQAMDKNPHLLLNRSNSLPLQTASLNSSVHQLQMQILANNQSLQQLNVPPEVQQQLQQLQYVNLQMQLKHMNIQQQPNLQPKPQGMPGKTDGVSVKKEEVLSDSCSFSGKEQENMPASLNDLPSPSSTQQENQLKHLQPGTLIQGQVDHVNQALVHLQEQAQLLDSHSHEVDSNPGSVESQVLCWEQQHPLFDGEAESYPSPGSQYSDMSDLSPLQVDQLSRSMDALQNINLIQGGVKSEHYPMQRSYSERSSDSPDDLLLMMNQTKPRSMSEPQFPNTHKRSLSFPNVPFTTPPPSYEAHMAAQSQKLAGQLPGGFPVQTQIKQEEVDLPVNSVIHDKELSQELHKAMMKNPIALNHEEILEILGDPSFHQQLSPGSFTGATSPSRHSHGSHVQTMSKSPSFGFLGVHSPPPHNLPGRMSKSCEDVSHLLVGNKPYLLVDHNTMSDFDTMMMSPMSPMKLDSNEPEDDSGLSFHSSDSIPIPAPNGGITRTDNLGWLDLSVTPPHQSMSHNSLEAMHNSYKGTPPTFLFDPMTPFKVEEPFHLSLFDLETPTSLHAPSDFSEAMDYCV